ADFLRLFTALPPTQLEIVESIDFLRIIGHDHSVTAVVFDNRTQGVDRIEDVARVEAILREDAAQAALFDAIKDAA
ncbi:MAG: 3-deoxy-manno-octulosonate cytidylyltransferase, partial [Pseudomonadota bacterium]